MFKEKIERLGQFYVYCSDVHKFGTDAVVLADFAYPERLISRTQNMCEFGCGCGIITMLCCQRNERLNVTAVDIQADAVELAKSGVEKNKISDRVNVMCADLKSLPIEMNGSFDTVIMNPPYKRVGAGLVTGDERVDIARVELKCNIDDICKSASKLLKFHGRLCICNRPERLGDTILAMYNAGLTPKRLRLVSQNLQSNVSLVLIEASKGGSSGMTVEPQLLIDEEHDRLFKDYFNSEGNENNE